MAELTIDLKSTALVLIDLQKGIVARPSAPWSGQEVVRRAAQILHAFRQVGATVVLVHVTFHDDGKDRLTPQADSPMQVSAAMMPPNWADFVPEMSPQPMDIVISKRHWGAFYGTELDLQLRRRNIRTIVLGGISTNYGVESTARDAYERGYQLVFAENAMASASEEAHNFSIKNIFPRIGMVRSTDEIIKAIRTS